jgi:hypothetical protein
MPAAGLTEPLCYRRACTMTTRPTSRVATRCSASFSAIVAVAARACSPVPTRGTSAKNPAPHRTLCPKPGTRVLRGLAGRELPVQQRGKQRRQYPQGQGRECQQLVILSCCSEGQELRNTAAANGGISGGIAGGSPSGNLAIPSHSSVCMPVSAAGIHGRVQRAWVL